MIVQVAAVHQIQDEAELIRRVERISHADNKRAVRLQSCEGKRNVMKRAKQLFSKIKLEKDSGRHKSKLNREVAKVWNDTRIKQLERMNLNWKNSYKKTNKTEKLLRL